MGLDLGDITGALSFGVIGSDEIDNFTGKSGADAAGAATAASIAFQEKGLAEMIRQFGLGQENIAPFLSAGTGALGQVQQGSTIGGLDEALRGIFESETFGGLKDQRMNSMMGTLGATGLTRSGAGLEEMANIPQDLAMQIEALLTGRQTNMATMGANVATGNATNSANFGTNINNAYGTMGATSSQGILGAQQASAAGTQNLLNLGGLLAGL